VKHKRIQHHGWFVGNFKGAAVESENVEVCYKVEPAGPIKPHYHTKCTETILLVEGRLKLQGQFFEAGSIMILEPGEVNDTDYLENCQVICVKIPAGGNDKVFI
jgi:quercetin dioxygenase-like cupin family protein